MRVSNFRFGCLWLVWAAVDAYPAQMYGYGPSSSESIRSRRPAWYSTASDSLERPRSSTFTRAHYPAIPTSPQALSYRHPPIPHYSIGQNRPRPPPPQPVQNFNRFPGLYTRRLPPSHATAAQQHVYWYRPKPAPIYLRRPPPMPHPVQPPPHAPLTTPLRSNAAVHFRKLSSSYLRSAPIEGNYGQRWSSAENPRVFNSPLMRDRKRIAVAEFSAYPTEYHPNPESTEPGDELPREEPTTPQADFVGAESQANASSRFPWKVYHGIDYDSDENESVSSLEGGCGEELACRTTEHCAQLGGRPTFLPCGASPKLSCCDLSRAGVMAYSTSNDTVKSDPQCGWARERTSRIIGGRDTEFGEIPWQAFVKVDGIRCGGALLNRNHVVTAAHCVVGRRKSKIEVLLGELVLKRFVEELPHERRRVAEIILHPDYENLNVDSYDVAILVLDKPVEYQANIMPICLPQVNQSFIGRLGTVSGWGRIFADHEIRTNHLQAVQVPIIGNGLCRKWLRSRGKYAGINADHVCAGYEAGGRDSCRGDSGGPLTYQKNGRWYLVGIVSAGFSCGKPRQPGIYHRVSHSAEWISKHAFP